MPMLITRRYLDHPYRPFRYHLKFHMPNCVRVCAYMCAWWLLFPISKFFSSSAPKLCASSIKWLLPPIAVGLKFHLNVMCDGACVCGTVLTPALSIPQPEPQARIIILLAPIFSYTADMHTCSQCGAVVRQQINKWSACVFVRMYVCVRVCVNLVDIMKA